MNQMTPLRALDTARLRRSGFFQAIGLILSSWIGLLIGCVVFFMSVVGVAVAFGGMLAGWITVPIFGFVFAAIGLSRSRDAAIRQTRTALLPPAHPLHRVVAQLAERAGIPTPQVGIYPDEDINAFAAGAGPHKAVVTFSKGLVSQLAPAEISAIAAHEVAHIANNDMRRMQRAMSFQSALTWYLMWTYNGQALARWVLGTWGELLVLKLSRNREYWADATAAALVGREPMIAALRRLESDPVQPSPERLAYARLMIRSNPREWFSTHPPIPKRIEALQAGTYIERLPYLGS